MASGLPAPVPAEIPQFRLPKVKGPQPELPAVYGAARLYFGDSRQSQDGERRVNVIVPLDPAMRSVDWDRAQPVEARPDELVPAAPAGAAQAVPSFVTDVQRFSKIARDFHRWLGRTQRAEVFRFAPLKMTSKPGESESAFLDRVRAALQKKRDLLADRLRRKRKAKQSLAQAEADLQALPEASDITPASLERVVMRPRRGGTTVDLVALVWK